MVLPARTQAINQLRALVVTAPLELAQQPRGLTSRKLLAAGDNPDRLRSEAAFAKLAADAPIEVSSGRRSGRHRLNRGGHRQANRALHTIAVSRIRWPDDRTREYVTRRNPNGEFKADLDIRRRLKRYIARELCPIIIEAPSTPPENLAQAA